MKKIITAIFLLYSNFILGQGLNKNINRDSLARVTINSFPEEKRKELFDSYNKMPDDGKGFFLFMLRMPTSSKEELVHNIDSNYMKIEQLIREYTNLVPKNYSVYIEFNPGDSIFTIPADIDIKVTNRDNSSSLLFQEWNLAYNSKKLNEILHAIGWSNKTLDIIKPLLKQANCISIKNGDPIEVGFARSGMGKYSFLWFRNNLTKEQTEQYNDGCSYIFYKKNIVLEYGGGAIGSQCFPE